MSHGRPVGRRRFLELMGLGVVGGVLAACGPTPQPSGAPTAKPAENATPVPAPGRVVEVRYLTPWPKLRLDKMKPEFDKFQETYPNIKVVLDMADWDEFRQKLQTQMAGGNPPEVSFMDSRAAPLYMDNGKCVNLEPRFNKVGIKLEDYLTVGIEKWCDGGWYIAPFIVALGHMEYNPTMFEKFNIPDPWDMGDDWTWDAWRKAAQMATQGSGTDKTWGMHLQPHRAYRNIVWMIYGNGGRWWNADTWEYTLSLPENIEAVQYAVDMYQQDKSIVPQSDADGIEKATGSGVFAAQKVAMTWDDTGDIAHNVATASFPFAICPEPKRSKDADWPPMFVSADGHFIPTGCKAEEEAFELIRMLGSEGMQTIIAKERLHFPALLKVGAAEDSIYGKPPPAHIDHLVKRVAGKTVGAFVNPTANQQNSIWESYMQKILLNQMTVEDGLAAAEKEMNELVKSEPTKCHYTPKYW